MLLSIDGRFSWANGREYTRDCRWRWVDASEWPAHNHSIYDERSTLHEINRSVIHIEWLHSGFYRYLTCKNWLVHQLPSWDWVVHPLTSWLNTREKRQDRLASLWIHTSHIIPSTDLLTLIVLLRTCQYPHWIHSMTAPREYLRHTRRSERIDLFIHYIAKVVQ